MIEEYSKCNSCGELDTIVQTNDAGVCMECGTPEDYTWVEVEE